MTFMNIMGATAWLAPLALLFIATVFLPIDAPGGRDHSATWIPAAIVAFAIMVRWNRQSAVPKRWNWFAFAIAASLAGFGFGFQDDRLLSLGWCVYCFTWAKSHFEKTSKQPGTHLYSMMSFLPAVIIVLGLPQFIWLQIEQWQWKGLSNYAWAVV